METHERRLNLAFYEGSDGPRVMLFGSLNAPFDQLQCIFRGLSKQKGPFELHSLPFIRAFGGIELFALCSGSIFQHGRGKLQGVRQTGMADQKTFNWVRTAEGWDYLAELIDGLVNGATAGHQYLSSYPSEDAIIVLSKGEYGDEVLKHITQT